MKEQRVEKKSRKLTLSKDFAPGTIRVNDITLAIDADGKLTLSAPGDVTIIMNGTIQLKAPASEQANGITATVTKTVYNIGDVLPDGWIVGPVSPDTGIVMAIEPVSGALHNYQTWHKGQDHAKELCDKGHKNARLPSDRELKAIYNDVVKAGRNDNAHFNINPSYPTACYWSCTDGPYFWHCGLRAPDVTSAKVYDFGGKRDYHTTKNTSEARVRCIRDEPGIKIT